MRRLLLFALIALVPVTVVAYAARERPILLGQTEGFVDGELVVFDYTDNFICANAPLNDEACDLGAGADAATNPSIDAAETALLEEIDLVASESLDLIVIVPFFDANENGVVDALDDPNGALPLGIDVQCPENQTSGLAGGTSFGVFGHCIFHDHELDASPIAGVTVQTNVGPFTFPSAVIPLPNHSHIVDATPGGSVPWDTSAVLVLNPALWPDKDGVCSESPCLTSFDAIFDPNLQQGIDIVGPVPTSLFLFFGVHGLEP